MYITVLFQLAGKGLNIVLMSRSPEKLETVASEIGEFLPGRCLLGDYDISQIF